MGEEKNPANSLRAMRKVLSTIVIFYCAEISPKMLSRSRLSGCKA